MSRPTDDVPSGLTTTSYAVLAQLAVHPWSTYELARQRVRYFRYVWPRAESAIYREVKRLAAMRQEVQQWMREQGDTGAVFGKPRLVSEDSAAAKNE